MTTPEAVIYALFSVYAFGFCTGYLISAFRRLINLI